ncbi:MAG: hypothetical protein IKU80_01785, partial [Firmicutes bacterium]|nr:hypothetical protein [Bacillota bacterium]
RLSSDRFRVRVKGEEAAILKAFNENAKIDTVITEESAEEGAIDLLITGKEGTDPRETAFEIAKENGFTLLLIKSEKLTLEEVFLKVTENAEAGIIEEETEGKEEE